MRVYLVLRGVEGGREYVVVRCALGVKVQASTLTVLDDGFRL